MLKTYHDSEVYFRMSSCMSPPQLFCANFMHLLKFYFTVASQCKWVTTAYQNLCYYQSISPVIIECEKSPRKIFCFSNAYLLNTSNALGSSLPHFYSRSQRSTWFYSFIFLLFLLISEVYQHLVHSPNLLTSELNRWEALF